MALYLFDLALENYQTAPFLLRLYKWDANVYFKSQFVYPTGKPMPPHLLRCQGIAVAYYNFTLGRLEAGAPSTFAQPGFYTVDIFDAEEATHDQGTFEKFKVCVSKIESVACRASASTIRS